MPRRRHDSLSKDLLSDWLEPLGKVESPARVQGEERQIDLLFTAWPDERQPRSYRAHLGLLERIARSVAALEAFRNPCTADELRACLVKLVELHAALQRRARRQQGSRAEVALPQLWVLTPSLSEALREGFRAEPRHGFPEGVLGLAEQLGTSVVVLSRLPETPETLWLRLLGRGETQRRAFEQLALLPEAHPLQQTTRTRVLRWRAEASLSPEPSEADKELWMNTERLVAQWEQRLRGEGKAEGKREGRAEGKREGKAEGKAEAVLTVLRARGLGASDEQAGRIRDCRDLGQLERWLVLATTAESVDELLDSPVAEPGRPLSGKRRPRR